jgi:hypothetical protein
MKELYQCLYDIKYSQDIRSDSIVTSKQSNLINLTFKSCECIWRDFFINHSTGLEPWLKKYQILKKSFDRINLLNIFKKVKIEKKSRARQLCQPRRHQACLAAAQLARRPQPGSSSGSLSRGLTRGRKGSQAYRLGLALLQLRWWQRKVRTELSSPILLPSSCGWHLGSM